MKRHNRNSNLDGAASIVLLPLQPLDFVFWNTNSGQPPLQLIGCGFISALGTLQLTLERPSTSEIKDQVQ